MTEIDTLLVERAPGQTRVAALSNGSIIELHHQRRHVPGVGAVFRGRVQKVLPGSKACFVDIGLTQEGLLPVSGRPPAEGESVFVHVVQPPRGDKGTKLAELKDVSDELAGTASAGSGPALLMDAPHPVSWCFEKYAATLTDVVITPSDPGKLIGSLVPAASGAAITTTPQDIFAEFEVDDALEQALGTDVPLLGRGRIIIEPTAALTAIDIDAGPMMANDANAQAIPVIARQIRLRAIGGPIIIDLIPAGDRGAVVDALKAAVADDPVKTQVAGLTPEGRIELNRRRERASLADLYFSSARLSAPSVEAVALDLLRKSVRAGINSGSAQIVVSAHHNVVAALRGPLRYALDDAEATLKTNLTLRSGGSDRSDEFDIQTG